MTEIQNSTLRQELVKFYNQYSSQLSHTNNGIPPEVRLFFKSHDIAHVLFGCDISLYGEGSVKLWTVFGTSLGFVQHFKLYKKANAYELSKKFSHSHIIKNIFKLIVRSPLIIIRAKQMNKPWPWDDYDPFLDIPVSVIREEFNIKVLN